MFYTFAQNNSGGSFVVDENIAAFVIIEAGSKEEALTHGEEVGIYFDGCEKGFDCECCGDRWSENVREGTATPEIYGKPVAEYVAQDDIFAWTDPLAIIHYRDGKVVPIRSGGGE